MKPENLIYKGMSDSHTHLRIIEQKGINLSQLLSNLDSQGMGWILDAGVDVDDFTERLSYGDLYPRLIFAAGVHPNACCDEHQLETLQDQLAHPAVKALGEIGLDYFRKTSDPELQKCFFRRQLQMAKESSLPVIIHNREANADVYAILKEERVQQGVIHCYGADENWVKPFLDLGFYISFAGNVTYKNARPLQESAKRVPLDRLLVETDAPFLAAQEVRGKTNHPGLMGYNLRYLSVLLEQDPLKLAEITTRNFHSLFGTSND